MTLLEPSASERTSRVLETARLILRPPRPDDAPALVALINDRRIAENTARIPHPYRLADAEAFIAAAANDDSTFLVTRKDGTLVGGSGIGRLFEDDLELGYWFGVPYWRRGYATEAAQALIEVAFADGGCRRLVAGARVTNPASRRVLEKCGFRWTGVVLMRVRALGWSVPVDRFRLERGR